MACKKLNQGIAGYLQAHGFANVAMLVGTLSTDAEIEDCAISG
jgi:hypothetical protein